MISNGKPLGEVLAVLTLISRIWVASGLVIIFYIII